MVERAAVGAIETLRYVRTTWPSATCLHTVDVNSIPYILSKSRTGQPMNKREEQQRREKERADQHTGEVCIIQV